MLEWSTLVLSVGIAAIPLVGLMTRGTKGIGWQFIRFNVIAASLPLLALLALNKLLPGEAITPIVAAALGYAFGRASDASKDDV
jgi:hypothetical protein